MDRSAFGDGFRDSLPAVPPNIPFGMLFGATAVAVGIDPVQATALSTLTFAATAQLAAVDLLADGAALSVVLATVLIINLRYVVYSASIAPEVRHLSSRWRALIAYPLFDITYALAMARYLDGDADPDELAADPDAAEADGQVDRGADEPPADDGHRGWYYAGTALPFVGSFVVATAAGAIIGRTLGAGLQLDFAIPLIFLALLVPTIDGRPAVVAAVVAAGLAVLGAGLPFNLGLLVGLLAGIAAGAIADRGLVA